MTLLKGSVDVNDAWTVIILYRRFVTNEEGINETYFMGCKYINHPKLDGRSYFAAREKGINRNLPDLLTYGAWSKDREVEFKTVPMNESILRTFGYHRWSRCWYNVINHEIRPLTKGE